MLDGHIHKLTYQKYNLKFIVPGGTSRGVLRRKESWFLKVTNTETQEHVWGECGILRGLSYDDRPGFEEQLAELATNFEDLEYWIKSGLIAWPSIRFGLEMALKNIANGMKDIYYDSLFVRGAAGVKINGLIWMSSLDNMLEQVKSKLADGYSCIKIKIGAIDWNEELVLLKYLRKTFGKDDLEVRVDANGAFSPGEEVKNRLNDLSQLGIHSIEQPIKQGQWRIMEELCKNTPVPIALDEELIGLNKLADQKGLLDAIKPQYIILKPSFLGGFEATENWIQFAKEREIGCWITSALESNIGLNAISQFAYVQDIHIAQGLGTGSLYSNNIPSPLYLENEFIKYNPLIQWDYSNLVE